jgi:hypothetical protein
MYPDDFLFVLNDNFFVADAKYFDVLWVYHHDFPRVFSRTCL